MKLHKISLFYIICLYIVCVLGSINSINNNYQIFKEFSSYYYSCYFDTEDESLLDLKLLMF